jgi:peptide/nickel transport system permease protein
MTLYIARRLVWTFVVVACVLAITFAVFYLLPAGDPALRFAGKNPTDAELALIHHRLGLDKPWYVQFGKFTKNFFLGDQFGWPGLGYTYAGQTSAVKRRSLVDRLAMGFALFGISTPVFWLGLMALYIFWRQLGWTGGSGYVSPLDSVTGFFSHMILPWIVLALLYAAFYARMTRNNLLETLGEDYIRTARAKGLSERKVIFKHGLRASLTPIVTMFGLDIALLVGGAIITESVFNLQGLGYLAINNALQQDLPVVLGVVLLASVAVALANLIVDVLYAFIDPRVRYA